MTDDDLDLIQVGPHHPKRPRALIIGGVAAAALALGGGAVALATTSSSAATPSATATATASGSTKATPPAPRAHTPHLDGTVTSVSGTTILIKDRDGFTRTIRTSSATKYTDGLTSAPAKGTHIDAEGKVDADGTSLDATTVGKAPAMPPGGPGRPGPGGPGGPWRGHGPGGTGATPSGTPPTGAPSGTATTTPTPAATPS